MRPVARRDTHAPAKGCFPIAKVGRTFEEGSLKESSCLVERSLGSDPLILVFGEISLTSLQHLPGCWMR